MRLERLAVKVGAVSFQALPAGQVERFGTQIMRMFSIHACSLMWLPQKAHIRSSYNLWRALKFTCSLKHRKAAVSGPPVAGHLLIGAIGSLKYLANTLPLK